MSSEVSNLQLMFLRVQNVTKSQQFTIHVSQRQFTKSKRMPHIFLISKNIISCWLLMIFWMPMAINCKIPTFGDTLNAEGHQLRTTDLWWHFELWGTLIVNCWLLMTFWTLRNIDCKLSTFGDILKDEVVILSITWYF
jgi:hypothetical protein